MIVEISKKCITPFAVAILLLSGGAFGRTDHWGARQFPASADNVYAEALRSIQQQQLQVTSAQPMLFTVDFQSDGSTTAVRLIVSPIDATHSQVALVSLQPTEKLQRHAITKKEANKIFSDIDSRLGSAADFAEECLSAKRNLPSGQKIGVPLPLYSKPTGTMGISTPVSEVTEGGHLPVYIWETNDSDKKVPVFICCNVSYLGNFELFDSRGKKVLTRGEIEMARPLKSNEARIGGCMSCAITGGVQPHSCSVVDQGDLSLQYDLPPGRYFLGPKQGGDSADRHAPQLIVPVIRLVIDPK